MSSSPIIGTRTSAVHSLRLPDMSKAPSALTHWLMAPVATAALLIGSPGVTSWLVPLQWPGPYVRPYGNGLPVMPSHAASHSSAVHKRKPAFMQASCAAVYVTEAHGNALALEQARALEMPPPLIIASGRDASYL